MTYSVKSLIDTIKKFPSDEEVPIGTQGYNLYSSQKSHWLGWLDSKSTSGTYQRKDSPDRDAKYIYNHIMEPKMLLWLISASGVNTELIKSAQDEALKSKSMASNCAAIRKVVPWHTLELILKSNA